MKGDNMNDDYFEEDESIFGEDEILDCIILDEVENKTSRQKESGCLTSILFLPTALIIAIVILLVR